MSRPETTLPAELVRLINKLFPKFLSYIKYSIITKKKPKNTLQSKYY